MALVVPVHPPHRLGVPLQRGHALLLGEAPQLHCGVPRRRGQVGALHMRRNSALALLSAVAATGVEHAAAHSLCMGSRPLGCGESSGHQYMADSAVSLASWPLRGSVTAEALFKGQAHLWVECCAGHPVGVALAHHDALTCCQVPHAPGPVVPCCYLQTAAWVSCTHKSCCCPAIRLRLLMCRAMAMGLTTAMECRPCLAHATVREVKSTSAGGGRCGSDIRHSRQDNVSISAN